jgi:hypothetical protein
MAGIFTDLRTNEDRSNVNGPSVFHRVRFCVLPNDLQWIACLPQVIKNATEKGWKDVTVSHN